MTSVPSTHTSGTPFRAQTPPSAPAGLAVFRAAPAFRLLAVLVGGLAVEQAMVLSVLVLFARARST